MVNKFLKDSWLVTYNAFSAAAWALIFASVVRVATTKGFDRVAYEQPLLPASLFAGATVDKYARVTQCYAVVEVLHTLSGIVPAAVLTTVMQVASRLFLVLGVTPWFPANNASPFYTSMLLAWSATEVVRYSFFVLKVLAGGGGQTPLPYTLRWLRYSAYRVLYPVGISSELAMIYLAWKSPQSAVMLGGWYQWLLVTIVIAYAPGSPILFSHMQVQRKKQLRGGSKYLKKAQ